MNCKRCNFTILSGAKFCTNCGDAVETPESENSQPQPQSQTSSQQLIDSQQSIVSQEPEAANQSHQSEQEHHPHHPHQSEQEHHPHHPHQSEQPQYTVIPDQAVEKSHRFVELAQKINSSVGLDAPFKLRLKEVFSDVFVKHTEEDAENLFFVGTKQTTPNIENVMDHWPKPWLFARIFIIVGLLYFGLFIGVEQFQNINFLPGLITMGSFMVPLTILIFFWELNAPKNISIYKIIKILFIGGLVSLFIAVFIFENIITGASVIIIGIVEEVAKLLVTLWFLRDKRYNYIFNGLLIGAAVGTGFAAFESAGYALQMALFDNLDRMYSTIFWRGVLAPGGHIVWAALSGAAICMVKGNRNFKWSMLRDFRFLEIFGLVVVLHSLWNIQWGTVMQVPLAQICFTIISWIFALGVLNLALKELIQLKENHAQQQNDMISQEQSETIDPIPVEQQSNIST